MSRPKISIELVSKMTGHKDAVYDFAYSESTNQIFSAGADGYVVAWDLNQPDKGVLVLTAPEALYSIAVNQSELYAGSRSGILYEIDLDKKQIINQSKRHNRGIFFVNSDFSGGENGNLNNKKGIVKKLSDKSLRCIASDDNYWYIGASDYHIYQLNKGSLEISNVLKGHTNSVFGLELIDNSTLVSTGRDATIKAWDLTIGQEVHSVPAHDYQAKSLSWNGSLLLSSSMDKTIKIWSDKLELWKVIDFERYEGHTNCINKVLWIDENMFVSCSDDRSLCLWKVEINT